MIYSLISENIWYYKKWYIICQFIEDKNDDLDISFLNV